MNIDISHLHNNEYEVTINDVTKIIDSGYFTYMTDEDKEKLIKANLFIEYEMMSITEAKEEVDLDDEDDRPFYVALAEDLACDFDVDRYIKDNE